MLITLNVVFVNSVSTNHILLVHFCLWDVYIFSHEEENLFSIVSFYFLLDLAEAETACQKWEGSVFMKWVKSI